MHEHGERQTLPVKLYRTSDRVTVAAPLPGLYPENSTVGVTVENHLVLQGLRRPLEMILECSDDQSS